MKKAIGYILLVPPVLLCAAAVCWFVYDLFTNWRVALGFAIWLVLVGMFYLGGHLLED
jgi:hypothetical protein